MRELGAQAFTCDIDREALSTLNSDIKSYSCYVANSKESDAVFDDIIPNGIETLYPKS